MNGKKQPLPDLKNPGISAMATAKQVGKSKTCPVRGISRCRVKMFEDRGLWCVLNCSKFFLFVEVPCISIWSAASCESSAPLLVPTSKYCHGQSSGAQAGVGLEQSGGPS